MITALSHVACRGRDLEANPFELWQNRPESLPTRAIG